MKRIHQTCPGHPEATADGSSQVLDPAFAQWQGLSVQWLHKTFGKPELVDKNTSRMAKHLRELGVELPGQKNPGNA